MDEKRTVHNVMMDRISDLPRNLLDCILVRMTTRDIARTSILSKKWRYIWATHSQLVFDQQFFDGIKKREQCKEFVRIINQILLLHSGPILKFILWIPNIHFNQVPYIDQWILVLSRNGIKKLTLDNNSNRDPYKLPSYIFSCLELMTLKLSNCELNPPLAFGGFNNLIRLKLENILFSTNKLGTLLPSAPVLLSLVLENCTNIDHMRIRAPKLYSIVVKDSHEFNWQYFNCSQNLRMVCIALCKEVQNSQPEKTIDLLKFLGNLPRIEMLWLDSFSLKFLAAGTIPKCLPFSVDQLTHLGLLNFGFNDFDQISCALCLLRSSPNLQYLEIQASRVTDDVIEQVLNYLKAPDCMDRTLDQLQTVKLRCTKGLRAELLFIKLLLVRSPSLERMIIEQSSEIDVKEELRMSRELMRFRRASTIAEIIYLNPTNS